MFLLQTIHRHPIDHLSRFVAAFYFRFTKFMEEENRNAKRIQNYDTKKSN